MKVLTSAVVHKVNFTVDKDGSQIASGVSLEDGRQMQAGNETILSASTIKTPQILILSGIGPA